MLRYCTVIQRVFLPKGLVGFLGLSLTATATDSSIENLGKVLKNIHPVVIKAYPERPNIFLEKFMRPPNNDQNEKIRHNH